MKNPIKEIIENFPSRQCCVAMGLNPRIYNNERITPDQRKGYLNAVEAACVSHSIGAIKNLIDREIIPVHITGDSFPLPEEMFLSFYIVSVAEGEAIKHIMREYVRLTKGQSDECQCNSIENG